MSDRKSYTSAGEIPYKFISDTETLSELKEGIIFPKHLQFIPTNRCNLKCNWCSCSEEDRELEIPIYSIFDYVKKFAKMGAKAVTITGGGEPTLHPYINKIIDAFVDNNIKIGLVSNGTGFSELMKSDSIKRATWCRISLGDDRKLYPDFFYRFSKIINYAPDVAWAISYVLSTPHSENVIEPVSFVNDMGLSHIRLVTNILNPASSLLANARGLLIARGISTKKVIFQDRSVPKKGTDCLLGYLKPLIGADQKVYACCGVQYALDPPSRKMPKELCLGSVSDLFQAYENKSYKIIKGGSLCKKCYYSDYNNIINAMMGIGGTINHGEFI